MQNFVRTFIFLLWGFFFLVLGVSLLLIPLVSAWQQKLLSLIDPPALFWLPLGLLLIAIGLCLGGIPFLGLRRRVVQIRSLSQPVEVDIQVLEGYLNRTLRSLFPHEATPFRMALREKRIRIQIDLPPLSEPKAEILLEKIERETRKQFDHLLGIEQEIEWIFSIAEERLFAKQEF